MTDRTDELHEQQGAGERSEMLLKALETEMTALEKRCWDTFRISDLHDDDGRMACRYYLQVLDDVRNRFKFSILQGHNSTDELVRMNRAQIKEVTNGR